VAESVKYDTAGVMVKYSSTRTLFPVCPVCDELDHVVLPVSYLQRHPPWRPHRLSNSPRVPGRRRLFKVCAYSPREIQELFALWPSQATNTYHVPIFPVLGDITDGFDTRAREYRPCCGTTPTQESGSVVTRDLGETCPLRVWMASQDCDTLAPYRARGQGAGASRGLL